MRLLALRRNFVYVHAKSNKEKGSYMVTLKGDQEKYNFSLTVLSISSSILLL